MNYIPHAKIAAHVQGLRGLTHRHKPATSNCQGTGYLHKLLLPHTQLLQTLCVAQYMPGPRVP